MSRSLKMKTLLALLLLCPGLALGAITRVQSATANSGASNVATLNLVLGAAPTNGNLLILAVGLGNGVPILESSSDITWTVRINVQAVATRNVFIFIGRVRTGSASATITVGSSVTSSIAIVGDEYSGFTNPRMDRSMGGGGSSASAASGTTPTTASANELWIGALSSSFAGGTTFSAPTNSFTIVGQTNSSLSTSQDRTVALLELIVSSTGTANAGATVGNGQWGAEVITIEETPSSGGSGGVSRSRVVNHHD